jgi:hypothetical protein
MSIISTTKELVELAKKGATVELEIRLVRMQGSELELREEIVQLKSELAELKQSISNEKDLEFVGGMYVKGDDHYCQVCWDADKKLIRLQERANEGFDELNRLCSKGFFYSCLKCTSNYGL